jgi:hypothetical protein
MSFSTMAATRQKEMKVSIALDATSTRAAVDVVPESLSCVLPSAGLRRSAFSAFKFFTRAMEP